MLEKTKRGLFDKAVKDKLGEKIGGIIAKLTPNCIKDKIVNKEIRDTYKKYI